MKDAVLATGIVAALLLLMVGCATGGPLGQPNFRSRQDYVTSQFGLSSEVRQAILDGLVVLGMTKEEVRTSWGEPSDVQHFPNGSSSYTTEFGEGEGWYYHARLFSLGPSRYVRFSQENKVIYVSEQYK